MVKEFKGEEITIDGTDTSCQSHTPVILIILIIFVKQRTYLAPPHSAGPPNLKKDLKYQILKMVEQAAPGRDRAT